VRKIGTKEKELDRIGNDVLQEQERIRRVREILENCEVSERDIIEVLEENREIFLRLFRTLYSKTHSRKKHLPFSFLISAGIPTDKRGDAKGVVKRLLALGILNIDSGKSVKLSEVGKEISKVLFNKEFRFQEKPDATSSFKKITLNLGVKDI